MVLDIRVADLHISVNAGRSSLDVDVAGRRGDFVGRAATRGAGAHLAVTVSPCEARASHTAVTVPLVSAGSHWRMARCAEGFLLELGAGNFRRPLWSAWCSEDFSRARVAVSPDFGRRRPARGSLPNPFTYPLDQILIVHYLATHNGVLIHAAGTLHEGRSYLFPGVSGAGKSTLTRQFTGEPAFVGLSDDRILVRELDGELRGYGTPWAGEGRVARNEGAPLGGIYFLAKGSANRLRELDRRSALHRLFPVASIPWYDEERRDHLLDFCARLVGQVPVYELEFTPTPAVAGLLREHFSAPPH